MALSQETRFDSYHAMIEANAKLMEEIYNDGKMNPSEKLKNFSIGVRNQTILNRDVAARRKELVSMGVKPNGNLQGLTFNPYADPAAE